MGIYRLKALIPAPLPRVWEYIIDPRNQPLWVPYIESVAGVDRPLQAGDRLIQWRRNFIRRKRVELLVEEVIPYRSFRARNPVRQRPAAGRDGDGERGAGRGPGGDLGRGSPRLVAR